MATSMSSSSILGYIRLEVEFASYSEQWYDGKHGRLSFGKATAGSCCHASCCIWEPASERSILLICVFPHSFVSECWATLCLLCVLMRWCWVMSPIHFHYNKGEDLCHTRSRQQKEMVTERWGSTLRMWLINRMRLLESVVKLVICQSVDICVSLLEMVWLYMQTCARKCDHAWLVERCTDE